MFINEKMKVICYPDPNIKPKQNATHIINFFGILGCIKVNALGKDESREQESEFYVVRHYFDYPYFSSIVNPKLFKKELDDEERKFTRRMYHYGYVLLYCPLLLLCCYTWRTRIKNQKKCLRG